MVTDYDCWHPGHDAVTVNQIVANLMKNAENACKVVAEAVARIPAWPRAASAIGLSHAILTDPQAVPAATRQNWGYCLTSTSCSENPREILDRCLVGPASRGIAAGAASTIPAGKPCSNPGRGLADRFELPCAMSTRVCFRKPWPRWPKMWTPLR